MIHQQHDTNKETLLSLLFEAVEDWKMGTLYLIDKDKVVSSLAIASNPSFTAQCQPSRWRRGGVQADTTSTLVYSSMKAALD